MKTPNDHDAHYERQQINRKIAAAILRQVGTPSQRVTDAYRHMKDAQLRFDHEINEAACNAFRQI